MHTVQLIVQVVTLVLVGGIGLYIMPYARK